MYRNNQHQFDFKDFHLPFVGKLRSDNRRVKLAKFIPWDEFEIAYRKSIDDTALGTTGQIIAGGLGHSETS
jgi:hypothetical protein